MTGAVALHSAIYTGSVVHTRFRPAHHRLRYRMFTLLLDLDELPRLTALVPVLSVNRFNLFAFYERDHVIGGTEPLRKQVEFQLARGGISVEGGTIRLLCMPRVLGRAFNPISVFFCYGADTGLRALLYQVNNTFGERHCYLIPTTDAWAAVQYQQCDKRFFVSPFMEMDLQYHFRLMLPGERVSLAIQAHDASGRILSAGFAGHRQALTTASLLLLLARYPLLALQVLASIHWEALKLWRKGVRWRQKPAPPTEAVSIIRSRGPA